MELAIDRKIRPSSQRIDKVKFVKPRHHILGNCISLYEINSGNQDLLKIEFIFPAGLWYQHKPLIAHAANNLLINGTNKHSANQIAETLDYYGAFLETKTGKDNAYVTLYCLNKHLGNLLPLFEEIIKYPAYPEEELQIYLKKHKQQFIVNNKKVNYLAKNHFNEMIYGSEHPYGKLLKEDDFVKLSGSELASYHEKHYASENIKIIIAGKLKNEYINTINRFFGGNDWIREDKDHNGIKPILPAIKQNVYMEKPEVLQSAIRIGRILFKKNHQDYAGMQVLNTILGGYFGSRLMKNIREDKGFTYGIGSAFIPLRHSGYFFIATEAGIDVSKQTVKEIYKEVNNLKNKTIPEAELELVRNYMMGVFLRNLDGPFVMADSFKELLEHDLDNDFYNYYIHVIQTITPGKIKLLAEKYLNEESLAELIVGKY